MRNPCIGCTDGAEDRKDCQCTRWEERIEYLNYIQHGGIYLTSVGAKVVVANNYSPLLPEGKETKSEKEEMQVENKLTNLNDHLFSQLERLSDVNLKGENLSEEISRSKAVSQIASQIIFGGKLALEAQIALRDGNIKAAPGLLGIANEEAKTA